MPRKRNAEASSIDDLADKFTVVGDPANLPDAFIDALASLLIDCHKSEMAKAPAKKKERSKSRPAKSKIRQARAGDTAT